MLADSLFFPQQNNLQVRVWYTELGLVCADLICGPWNTMLGFCVQTIVGWVFDFLNTSQARVFEKKKHLENHEGLGFWKNKIKKTMWV